MKKIYEKLKTAGVKGLVYAGKNYFAPYRLRDYSKFKSSFQSKVGLEIGGPSKRMFGRQGHIPIYPIAKRIDNCNFCRNTVWEGDIDEGDSFVFNKGAAPGTQYICEASNLGSVKDYSYDFILSSHCVEHLANPLKAITEWVRVLKQDGLLVLIIPHKDGTFDHRRLVTSLEHLVSDLVSDTDEGDLTHLAEILRFHDLERDPGAGDFKSFQERSNSNLENRCLHHHVFDTSLVVDVVDFVRLQILTVEPFCPFHVAIVARKMIPNQMVCNKKYQGADARHCWSSPFPSDRVGHQ
jgi:SAM-dependent methyltransferase